MSGFADDERVNSWDLMPILDEWDEELRGRLVRTLLYYERCHVACPLDGEEVFTWYAMDELKPLLGHLVLVEFENGSRQLNQLNALERGPEGWKAPLLNSAPRRWAYASILKRPPQPLVTLHGVFNADELRDELAMLERIVN